MIFFKPKLHIRRSDFRCFIARDYLLGGKKYKKYIPADLNARAFFMYK